MSTTATTPTTPTSPTSTAAPRVTAGRVVTSEWIKARSLRSTAWTLVALAVSLLGTGAFAAVGIVVQEDPPGSEALAADPTGGVLTGVSPAQLAAIALGVLLVSGEYRSGTIRSSLTAVPSRLPLVWAKAAVGGLVTTVVSLVALLATFVVARSVVAVEGLSISPTTPGVARAVLGAALYLGLTAVLATGFGWLLRSTAGAVAAVVALLHLLPATALLVPAPVAAAVLPWFPSNAGSAVLQVAPVAGGPGPWTGLAVYAAWAAVALGAGALLLTRRDA